MRGRTALARRPLRSLRRPPADARPDLRRVSAKAAQLRSRRGALALRLPRGCIDHPLQASGTLALRPPARRAPGPPSAARLQRRPAAAGTAAAGAAGAPPLAPARLQPGADAGAMAGARTGDSGR